MESMDQPTTRRPTRARLLEMAREYRELRSSLERLGGETMALLPDHDPAEDAHMLEALRAYGRGRAHLRRMHDMLTEAALRVGGDYLLMTMWLGVRP